MFRRLGEFVGYISDTTSHRLAASLGFALLLGFVESLVHRAVVLADLSTRTATTIDSFFVGSLSGIALWLLLVGNCDRRQRVRDELARLAELNHEVRNSLEVIIATHYLSGGDEHERMVLESAKRIEQAIKALFPAVDSRQKIA